MGKNTKAHINLNLGRVEKANKALAKQALEDITTDLLNMSSQAAPIDEHILEGKFDEKYWEDSKGLKSEVSYSVMEESFNYAFFVHETHPVGGVSMKTKLKPDATSPISKKSFPAGGQFLHGPARLNQQAYMEYIEKYIKDNL